MSGWSKAGLRWMVVWIGVGLLTACSQGGDEISSGAETVEVSVLAAASLTDAVKEIKGVYEQEHPDIRVVPNFASSGKLQKQVEQGAPADLFLSAGKKELDALLEKGLIDPDYHTDFLRNRLVLIVSQQNKGKIKGFKDLIKADKIAIGQPETVPAGDYARQMLEYMGLWEKLQLRVVFAGDVRQVMTYVETGNVDAGLVYRTDAQTTDKVTVVAMADRKSHQPIIYPIGVVTASKHLTEARRLYDWLRGSKGKAIFKKYGFEIE